MHYHDAYNFLISLNNLSRQEYLRDPKHCDWYLKRMQVLLDLFGNPEKKIPHYIHVAGTSGKGSVCLMLNAILRTDGKKVGTLTSPHPSVILERWEVNGRMMSKREFVEAVELLKKKLEEYIRVSPYDVPSFSELMTILALHYFVKKKARWAVLEAGCGGRYDSTNIIPHKDVAVITNIGWDHMELLGDTKEKIAYEKAGIIKKGNVVFTQEQNRNVLRVIEQECRKQKANLKMSNVEYRMSNAILYYKFSNNFIYKGLSYHLPILGAHQIKNAILCIDIARTIGIEEAVIRRGLASVRLPIRLEVVSKKPLIILDGAHNEDKMKTTVETIKEIKKLGNYDIHLLIGFAANKDIRTMLKQLTKLQPKTIACTRFTNNIFRKTTNPADVARQLKGLLPRSTVRAFLDPREAFTWSRNKTKTNNLLLATGSMFLAGELRPLSLPTV